MFPPKIINSNVMIVGSLVSTSPGGLQPQFTLVPSPVLLPTTYQSQNTPINIQKNVFKFTTVKFYTMSASATLQELITYFNQLNTAEQQTVLQMLKTFLSNRKEGFGKQSLEDYTKELEQADAEIEAGDFVLHEDVVKYFSKK